MAGDFANLASLIRSVVVTSKTPLSLFEVNRDFKLVEDDDIPFREHQCRSLEELLRKIPDLNVFQQGGRTMVHIIPNEKNAHIAKMVRAQRSSKKKPSRSMNFNRYSGNTRRFPSYNSYPRTDVNRNNVQSKYSHQGFQYRVNTANSFSSRPNLAEAPKKPQASSAPVTQKSNGRSSPTAKWSPPTSRKAAGSQAVQQGSSSSCVPAIKSPQPAKQTIRPAVSAPASKSSPAIQQPTRTSGASSGWAPMPKSSPPAQQPTRTSTATADWAPMPKTPPPAQQPTHASAATARLAPMPKSPPAVQEPVRSCAAQPAAIKPKTIHPEAASDTQKPASVQQRLEIKAEKATIVPEQRKNLHAVQEPAPKPLTQQQRMNVRASVQQRLNVTWEDSKAGDETSPVQQRSSNAIEQRLASQHLSPSHHTAVNDPRLRLQQYTVSKELPFPIYKEVPTRNKNFLCSVTVGSRKYSSYPKEAKTEVEAEKLAAQAALDTLLKEDQSVQSTTHDRNLLTRRILSIVAEHPSGIFEKHVQEFYMQKYNEGLPSGWLKVVENEVVIDSGANRLPIISLRTGTFTRRPPSPPNPPRIVDPEPLRLHHMDEFAVHIYAAYSTTEIWGVIIDSDHSDQIYKLSERMEAHYTGDITEPSKISPGKHYAVFEEAWHRVRCIECDQDTQMATVFFIDRGDEDTYEISRLRPLLPEFCQLPAQAVRLSLDGLEIFEDLDGVQAMLDESLADKDVSVVKVSDGMQINMITAQLYLDVGNVALDVNSTLQCEILKKLDPANLIATEKSAQDVHISHVGAKVVYLQTIKGLQVLRLLMNDFQDRMSDSRTMSKSITKFSTDCLYATKLVKDNTWRRVKVIKVRDEDEAEVFSVDEGNTFFVKKHDLVPLEGLLATYPCQATLVRLHKISPLMFDKKMAEQLRRLAPKTDIFFTKVVGNFEKIPVVEIYQRTEKNLLASLNDTLALEPEIISKSEDNSNARSRLRTSVGARPEFPLKSPNIPPIGEFFDVRVTMSAHPGNFTVQPLDSNKELEEMMDKLSDVCSTYSGPALTPSSVKAGSMYAAKYEDGKWYRAHISRVINDTVFAVYFCDYGDYNAVSIQNLQPLQNQFYDLPYQAIKAKLHGVTPKLKDDWTVKDSLRFSELTVDRSFVSVVKSCDSNGETNVYSLELIDVSSAEDVYISRKLIEEERADRVE